jgi:hypothetical protein
MKEKLKDLLVSYWADAVDEPANIEGPQVNCSTSASLIP